MEFMLVIYLAMFVVPGSVYGLPALTVTLKRSGDDSVLLGKELKFVCEVNRNLTTIINNRIEIYMVRQSAIKETEVILTETVKYIGAEQNYYNVKIEQTEYNGIIIIFSILKVRELDEGKLICRVQMPNNNILGEDKQDIEIRKPLDVLFLTIAGNNISKTPVSPINLDSGTYNVTCIAEGSNPASAVDLYLNGTLVKNVERKVDTMGTKLKKWRTRVTGTVHIKVLNSKEKFKCEAKSPVGDKHTVELPFKINNYDPKVACNGSEAHEGQHDLDLTCLVEYEDLDITGFKFQFGDQEIIEEGKEHDHFVVSKKNLTNSKVMVNLTIKQTKKIHFERDFYLIVVHANGHETRESVRLIRNPGHSLSKDSSSNLNPTLATLFISLFALKLTL